MDYGTMAKNKKFLTDILPHIILVFALLSTILVIVHITQNLSMEGVFQSDQSEIEPTSTPHDLATPTFPLPTPTLPPIEDA
jgi:hypothetical protein